MYLPDILFWSSVLLEGIGGDMFTVNTFKPLLFQKASMLYNKMQILLFLMIKLENSEKVWVWDGWLQAAPRLIEGYISTSLCCSAVPEGKKLESTAFSYFLSFIFSLPHLHFKANLSNFFYSLPVGERICTLNGGIAQLLETIY